MVDPKDIIEEYKGWFIVESDFDRFAHELMAFPGEHGQPDHDWDYDGENYKYCGNCFFGSVEDIKDQIDEKTN